MGYSADADLYYGMALGLADRTGRAERAHANAMQAGHAVAAELGRERAARKRAEARVAQLEQELLQAYELLGQVVH